MPGPGALILACLRIAGSSRQPECQTGGGHKAWSRSLRRATARWKWEQELRVGQNMCGFVIDACPVAISAASLTMLTV